MIVSPYIGAYGTPSSTLHEHSCSESTNPFIRVDNTIHFPLYYQVMVVRDEGPQGKRSPGLFLSQGTRVLVSSPTCLVLLASIPEKYIHASFGQNLANLVSTLPPPPKSNFSTVTIRYFPVSKKCRGHGEVVTLPFT